MADAAGGGAPLFFETPAEFRAWLEANHASADELFVGFYRKGSGRRCMTYQEAVDEALCFGWIDGVRRSIDGESYMNRFSPRRPRSVWSAVNIARVEALTAEGRMRPAGRAAFERRDPDRTGRYSFERATVEFEPDLAAMLKQNRAAARFFHAQPPGYRRTATWWVMSAKRADTRLRRMQTLIDDSARGQRIALLRRPEQSRRSGKSTSEEAE
jgi:uncharacterized protein YdeI (YjbR/CyaY-like superfamily)